MRLMIKVRYAFEDVIGDGGVTKAPSLNMKQVLSRSLGNVTVDGEHDRLVKPASTASDLAERTERRNR